MLEIRTKLKVKGAAYNLKIGGRLRGPLALRSNSQVAGKLESGEDVKVNLSEGGVLHGGDLGVASDGRVIQIEATPETVVQARFSDRAALARAAFFLGSEHVLAQIGDGTLCIAPNDEAEKQLAKLGGALARIEAVLEPDPQTYAVSHSHDHHHHDHGHDHHHGHDHAHDHKHDHGHKHEHEHKHEHKHEAAHEHQHEGKHEGKHDHKHEPKHEHRHDAGHDHKHGKK